MQQFICYYKITLHVSGIYMPIFRSIQIQTYTQCTRLQTGSSEPLPQHLVLNAVGSSIQSIQPNTPEDGM